ncbi:benzoate/H(+) symporter BenE family transporter [Nakamurella flava]|uniref:Benzoate/H(+) symporter BenE family transporter n=1 Tax=Nakamurella flava TaxID=2576308 RepID=A0A4V6Y6U0_9ACTN|nr:benzoate/H(+) symporter BenE family transporter [Nakamurella flava]TKV61805.1 benzoate/H(+) symporter BenE family transporter [Nakamurella flava]
MERETEAALAVGVVTSIVGFTSSFAVVVAGLQAVGASTAQAACGLAVLCVLQGAGSIWLSRRHRMPLTLAWSTPGAALLVSAAGLSIGWSAAIGAFLVTGALLALTGLWPWLGRTVAAIPPPLGQAMLAGVLVPLCLEPVTAMSVSPALVIPVVVVWLVLQRWAPRWAAPAAFALAVVLVVVSVLHSTGSIPLRVPTLELTAPTFDWAAMIGIAVPLYLVTMAAQNVPGVAVLGAAGYQVPWRESLLLTGFGTVAGAAAGTHAVNLAAITAALPASAQAHPDPAKRWIASAAGGGFYILLAPAVPSLTMLLAAAPPGVLESVAGLALLGTLAASLTSALTTVSDETGGRLPAVVTFLVAASGTTALGIGAAFWALLAGLLLRFVLRTPKAARHAAGRTTTGR